MNTKHWASLTAAPVETSCEVVTGAKWQDSHRRSLCPHQLVYSASTPNTLVTGFKPATWRSLSRKCYKMVTTFQTLWNSGIFQLPSSSSCQGSQQQWVKFQEHVFSKFQDNLALRSFMKYVRKYGARPCAITYDTFMLPSFRVGV